jgi:hypothetical protein
MSKSRVDLGNSALERLKKLVAGETPDAVTAQAIDDRIDPLLANLIKRGVIDATVDADEIPDEMFDPLSLRLAWAAAGRFGVPLDQLPDCQPQVTEADLRILSGIGANSGDVIQFEDF